LVALGGLGEAGKWVMVGGWGTVKVAGEAETEEGGWEEGMGREAEVAEEETEEAKVGVAQAEGEGRAVGVSEGFCRSSRGVSTGRSVHWA
jgi:hypothetical protein